MPRKYVFWSNEDIDLLKRMICEGQSRKNIYDTFYYHSIGSVKHKMRKLGLTGHIEYGINKYIIDGEITKLILCDKNGKTYECLIDTDDMEYVLSCGRWHIAKRGRSIYATVGICQKEYYMHRLIMNCPANMVVDHINGNPLDCRKSNLRIITQGQNTQNQHTLSTKNSSGYRGVSWCKTHNKWRAVIKVNGKQIGGRYFDDKEVAHQYVVGLRAKYMPYSME